MVAAGTAVVVGGVAGVALVTGATAPVVAALLAAALVVGGGMVAAFGIWLPRPAHAEEDRHVKGPRLARRHLFVGAGAGAVALAAVSLPAARRVRDASDRLRQTSWRAGTRLVTVDGEPVRAGTLATGELLTVFPEGAVNEVDSQVVLVRESLERIVAEPGRDDWAPEGLLAYSKLCTHMACPVGLYQQQEGTVLCPCHQASFDLLNGGRRVQGPAPRALPQLPIAIGDDGFVVARGDFSDAVGTGFWSRP
jgi:ubiquinol-cytochrome c reductase iron-sulfur subunit